MLYDIATMSACTEDMLHKRAYVEAVLLLDSLTTGAETVLQMKMTEEKAEEIIRIGKAIFR